MSLVAVPVTGVAKTVADLAERDPEAARVLTELALVDVLENVAKTWRPEIDRVAELALEQTDEQVRGALVRTFAKRRAEGKPVDDLLPIAELVSKRRQWRESDHKRDPNTGRWVAQLKPGTGLFGREKHEDAAIRQMATWRKNGIAQGGDRVLVRTDQGEGWVNLGNTTNEDKERLKTVAGKPRALEISDKTVRQNAAVSRGDMRPAFDALAYATGSPSTAAGLTPSSQSAFSNNLERAVRQTSGNDRRAYRQLDVGGRALQAVATPGSGVHAAGAVAQLAGALGPEAERVLSPSFARIGYRYRGTEREPDKALVGSVNLANRAISDPNALGIANTGQSISLGARHKHAGDNTLVRGRPGEVGDQQTLLVRGDSAVGYFIGRIPSTQLAELSDDSQRTPPSEGTIIDQDGNVVTQAVGIGDDHYLPFDLKNLGALRGGQYVRTRVAGGPTSEDIYTGLMTGARQLQVVSNSGVFTLEFDPDLRGGRRYSDKASQMVKRYQALIASVESGRIEETPIPPKRLAEMRAEAQQYGAGAADRFKELKIAEREKAKFLSDASDEELQAAAEQQAVAELSQSGQGASAQALARTADDIYREMKSNQRDNQTRQLKLDAVGYGRALEALRQEFPYFIRRTSTEDLREFERSRGRTDPRAPKGSGPRTPDKGFVPAGQINRRGDVIGGKPREQTQTQDQAAPTTTPAAAGGLPPEAPGAPAAAGTPNQPTAPAAGAAKPALTALGPIKVPKPGRPLEEADSSRLKRTAQQALLAVDRAVVRPIGGNAVPTDDDKKAFAEKRYDDVFGDSALVGLFYTRGGPQLALEFPDLDPKVQKRVLNGLDEIKRDYQDDRDNGAANSAAIGKPEDFDAAIESLRTLGKIASPFADPPTDKDPFEHDGDKPLRFDDVAALGQDPANYDAFYAAASPQLKKHIDELRALPEHERSQLIAEEVDYYASTKKLAQQQPNTPVDPMMLNLPPDVELSNPGQARAYLDSMPGKQRFQDIHRAHAFVHAQEILSALRGGGAAPKAEGPAGPPPAVQNPFQQPPKTEKSARLERKVVVHPPDSAVAKAYQRAVAKRMQSRPAPRE